MQLNQFNNEVVPNIKNGAFIKAVYETIQPTSAKFKGGVITKRTEVVVRMGIRYSAMKINKGKVLSGDLPNGMVWYSKYLLENKNGELLVRFATSVHHKPHSEYFLNGNPITKQELIDMGAFTNSYLNSNGKGMRSVYNVKLDNIISIGA